MPTMQRPGIAGLRVVLHFKKGGFYALPIASRNAAERAFGSAT